jgi:membrane protease YdiL (CAAX protease family)
MGLLMVVLLVVVLPLAGHASVTALVAGVQAGDMQIRMRTYVSGITTSWLLTLVVLLLVVTEEGLYAVDVGLVLWRPLEDLAPFLVAALVLALLLWLVLHRLKAGGTTVVVGAALLALWPRTRAERRMFVAVAATAAVCEELLYRGFLLAVVEIVLPGVPPWPALFVAAALFGFAHLYQGAAGVVVTGLMGAIVGAIYIATGSLLVPVVLHLLLDLRLLLLPAPPSALPA